MINGDEDQLARLQNENRDLKDEIADLEDDIDISNDPMSQMLRMAGAILLGIVVSLIITWILSN